MTFVNALSQIPKEKQIAKQLIKAVFGSRGVWCPECGKKKHVAVLEKNRRFRCRICRNKFSVTSVSWLKGTKLPLQVIWCLIWCWQQKISVQQTRALLQLSIPTIRRYFELFRDHLELDFEVVLEGDVQMDEMFTKGRCVVGAKDIERKKIKLKVISNPYPAKQDAAVFIQNHVKPGSVLCTDGGGIYKGIEHWWPLTHVTDIHKRFEFEITSEIEGIWGVLRTFIRRMYHHVTSEKLPKVVAEFEARYSSPHLFTSPLTFLKNSFSTVKFAL